MPILTFPAGSPECTRLLLRPGLYTVGRDPTASVYIDDASVSPKHCEFTVYPTGECVVRDAGSEMGTHLDGRRISVATWLPGQTLTVGTIPCGWEEEPGPEPVSTRSEAQDSWDGSPETNPETPPATTAALESTTLWGAIPGAFAYGFRGQLKLVIGFFTAFYCVILLLPSPLGIAASIVGIVGGLYLFELGRDIVLTTANGDLDPPPNPDFLTDWDGLRDRVLLYLGVALVSFGPYAVTHWIPDCPFWIQVVLACLGGLYFPMALLGVVLADQAGPLSPSFVFRSIGRVLGDYVVVLVGFAIAFAIDMAFEWAGDRFGFNRFSHFVMALVFSPVGLYLKLVWLRILGLLYWYNREALGWDF